MELHFRRTVLMTGALLLVAIGVLLGTLVAPGLAGSPVTLEVAEAPYQLITDNEKIFSDIYNRVSPSVVSINIATQRGTSGTFIPEGLGTGVVLDTRRLGARIGLRCDYGRRTRSRAIWCP